MKKLLAILIVGLTGCTVMFPDHHVKWTGIREGRMMYEISCNNIVDCTRMMKRSCQERPWTVSLQWQSTFEHNYMIECYK